MCLCSDRVSPVALGSPHKPVRTPLGPPGELSDW
jgi:hypothetical protein